MNILVLLPVNDRHRAILESSAPGEDFIYTSADAATREQVADADVILGNIDPNMLTACEHLQLLQLQTAGYDDYLAAGTVPADAKLSCSVGAYGQAVSEHMFAMVLSMMKRLPGYQDLQREHRWEDLGPVTSLKNANVLVLDQPTNHLDLESITAVNNGLADFKGNVLFASHDHEFIQTVANRIMEFKGGKLTDYLGTYDDFIESRRGK